MESNIFISNVLNNGNLIHPKLPTAYMSGPHILETQGGLGDIRLYYPIEGLGKLTSTFLSLDYSNVTNVPEAWQGYPNYFSRVSPIGRVYLEQDGVNNTLVVERARYADRYNGNWNWSRLGLTKIFNGYISVYIGAERG